MVTVVTDISAYGMFLVPLVSVKESDEHLAVAYTTQPCEAVASLVVVVVVAVVSVVVAEDELKTVVVPEE